VVVGPAHSVERLLGARNPVPRTGRGWGPFQAEKGLVSTWTIARRTPPELLRAHWYRITRSRSHYGATRSRERALRRRPQAPQASGAGGRPWRARWRVARLSKRGGALAGANARRGRTARATWATGIKLAAPTAGRTASFLDADDAKVLVTVPPSVANGLVAGPAPPRSELLVNVPTWRELGGVQRSPSLPRVKPWELKRRPRRPRRRVRGPCSRPAMRKRPWPPPSARGGIKYAW